jgi:hypothetical protein
VLNKIEHSIECDFCDGGLLSYSPSETFEAYFSPESFALAEIDKILDEAINEYLVFVCGMCGISVKYTYKDVEKKIRENMYNKVIFSLALKEFKDSGAIGFVDKTLIYCGKCNGFNGKGACPVRIFNECKLKRLPYEL